jgi:LPS-assembly protein
MRWHSGYITPTLKVLYLGYDLEDVADGVDDGPSSTAPLASLDSGLFFERGVNRFGKQMLQTLEPRLFYLFVDEEEQDDHPVFDSSYLTFTYDQLFRETRFSGRDRLADANQLALSVTSRFLDESSGRELLSASIGQLFYFDDREVNLGNIPDHFKTSSNSEIATEISFSPAANWNFTTTLLWDTRQDRINEGGVHLNYLAANNQIFNASYRYRRNDFLLRDNGDPLRDEIDQFDISTIFPLGDNWNTFVRWQYDFNRSEVIEELFGFEYNDCCWALRVLYQRGLDGDNEHEKGVYLQFQLRGLGGLGTQIQNIIEDSIDGYSRSETRFIY